MMSVRAQGKACALSGLYCTVWLVAAHMAMSMLKRSTVVSITKRKEKNHVACGDRYR